MSARRRIQIIRPLRAAALGCTVLTAAMPAAGRTADAPVMEVAEPEGFADLAGEQTLLVDVYFGGERRGDAIVRATPDTVTFTDPAALLKLLPQVIDRAAVEAALASPDLPANPDRACSSGSDSVTCGRLSPQVAGVILDRDKLRLDVFLNPRLLAVEEDVEKRYLPPPAGGLSMINAVGAVLSGRSRQGQDYYSLQDQLLLANGPRRLRADLSYANDHRFQAERLALEWDRPELRYSIGALWTPGNDLTGRRKLIGLGVETQIDTRLDRDEIMGSPVVVFLDRRARIDVVHDGRVLNSAIYEAGNQEIDTSNLPEGSYQIVLRIDEPGQPTREERRFFTKSRRIPAVGRTDFFAFGGAAVDGATPGSLAPSSHPYIQAGLARRVSESWAIDGQIEAIDGGASGEIAATLLTKFAQVRAAAVVDLDGRYGAILQLTSSGMSRLNFNFDLRHVEAGDGLGGAQLPHLVSDGGFATGLASPANSYSQAGGVVSFSLANFRFLGVLSYRDEETQNASFSIGPSVQWDVLRKGPFTLTLRGDVAATERGTSEFAGLAVRVLGARSSMTALGGARASNIPDDTLGDGLTGSIAGTWNADAAGGTLALGAGLEHRPRQDDLVLSSEFRHPIGSLTGDYVRSRDGTANVSQYSVGIQTTIAAGAGSIRVAGRTTSESVIVARVDGAREGDRFDVLVDEQRAGTVVGSQPLLLTLPAYRAYRIRLRSTGKDLLAYDSSSREIGLYPGAVTRLDWKVAPVTIRFGQLVGPDGTPLRHASITGKGVWSETDDDGHFQIEAADDAELEVTTREGRSFALVLPPSGSSGGGLARLGSVTCCGSGGVKLTELERLGGAERGGAR